MPNSPRPRQTRSHLSERLDHLDALVPRLMEQYPDRGDLMEAFAADADSILDEAQPDQTAFVHERLDWIIEKHHLETP